MSRMTRYMMPAALAGTAAAAVLVARYANARRQASHPPDSAPGRTARQRRFGNYIVTGRSVTIDAPRSEIFARWRNTEALPRFMENVRSVEAAADGHQIWHLSGPMGSDVRLKTRIVEERQDEFLAWRSTEGSDIDAEGKLRLRDAPGGRGTVVEAIIAYRPPAGTVGHWIGKAFGKDPRTQGRHELKRLKMLVETGEIATAQNCKEI